MTSVEIDVYAEITNVVEMKPKINVGADGVTLEEMCLQLRLLHSNMEFMICDSATHHVVKGDGKKHQTIPEGFRIYGKHHEAPSALRAEIEARKH